MATQVGHIEATLIAALSPYLLSGALLHPHPLHDSARTFPRPIWRDGLPTSAARRLA